MEQVEYKLAGLLLYHLLNREDDCYEIKKKLKKLEKSMITLYLGDLMKHELKKLSCG